MVIPSFEGAFGFRVCKSSSDASYIIEVKRIVNFDDVNKQLDREFPLRSSRSLYIDRDSADKITLYNREQLAKRDAEMVKRFRIESTRQAVSSSFVEYIRGQIKGIREQSQPKESLDYILDGEMVCFSYTTENQCVELKSAMPQGKMRALSLKFVKMVEDIENGLFDQARFVK